MDTKNFEPTFQMVANFISKINVTNTIVNISNNQDLEKKFSLNIRDIHIEEHEGYKSAGLDVEIVALVAEKQKDNPKKIEIKIIVSGVFTDSTEVSDDELTKKLEINGTAALYSIARGCITNISSQTLAEGKIVLPLVNFIEASKNRADLSE